MGARLLSFNQPFIYEVFYPRPAYSRVVTLEFFCAAGIGNGDWDFTDVCGQNVWLYNIKIFASGSGAGVSFGGFVYLVTGTHEPQAAGELSTRWERIIAHKGMKPGMPLVGVDCQNWSWDMAKYWENAPRRFGIYVENFSDASIFRGVVAFLISEG